MYYIMNQSKQIVAIDPQLLLKVGASDVDALFRQLALGETSLELEGDRLTVNEGGRIHTYDVKVSSLSGILGELTLVDIKDAEEEALPPSPKEEPQEDEPLTLNDIDLFEIKEEADHTLSHEEKTAGEEEKAEKDDELFELLLPEEAESAIEQIDKKEEAPSTLAASQNAPIYIDVERISEKIGISTEDYNLFLNEYIDTALALEDALEGNNEAEQTEALSKLSHLSNVLHLPFVSDILEQIEKSSAEERSKHIESFFSALGRLSTAHFEEEMGISDKQPETETEEVTAAESRESPDKTASSSRREPIDLSNVKPIHFDFQLEAAAEDLSLPVELIEEFVSDFIQQAHEETKKMLAAYENGDLETVQKIGHLLKGTSSNLRINPLSDTLYEIQFNDDIERVPELVKNYWAHFLSLENQFKIITNK